MSLYKRGDTWIVDMRIHRQLGIGVYSDVYEVDGRAYKLFRNGPELPPKQTTNGRKQVFENQCEAYRLALNDELLRHHIPEFHGPANIQDVVDREGKSIPEYYLRKCCYSMSICEGKDDPVALHSKIYKHVEEALRRFRNLGIHAHDGSIFLAFDPEAFQIIDFETPFQLV